MLRNAVPFDAILADAVVVLEAIDAGVQIAVRVEHPVVRAVLLPGARDTHVELGATQKVLTIGAAGIFACSARLRAAPSFRVASFALNALAVPSALDTASELRITNIGIGEGAVIRVGATGRAEGIAQRAKRRPFIRATAFAKAREVARSACRKGADAPAAAAVDLARRAAAAAAAAAAAPAPGLARSGGLASAACFTTRRAALSGAVKSRVGQQIEGFSTTAPGYAQCANSRREHSSAAKTGRHAPHHC